MNSTKQPRSRTAGTSQPNSSAGQHEDHFWTYAPSVIAFTLCAAVLTASSLWRADNSWYSKMSVLCGTAASTAGLAWLAFSSFSHWGGPQSISACVGFAGACLNALLFIFSLFLGGRMLTKVQNSLPCTTEAANLFTWLECSSEMANTLPDDAFLPILLAAVAPFLFPSLSRSMSFAIWIAAWAPLCVAWQLLLMRSGSSTVVLIEYAVASLVILRVQRASQFSSKPTSTPLPTSMPCPASASSVGILTSVERETALRSMIGNVAHDLKTPLASLVASTEVMTDMINEGLAGSTKKERNKQRLLFSLLSIVGNQRSVASFMLMMINRCLDFTKASKGLRLTPKYETVHLLEALALPLQCFVDVHDGLSIHLCPPPKEICSHIITDKQWLQENIMCLVSNAIKYSSQGSPVTIRLNLQSDKPSALSPSSKSAGAPCDSSRSPDQTSHKGGHSVDETQPLHSSSSRKLQDIPTPSETGPRDSPVSVESLSHETLSDSSPLQLIVEVEDRGIGLSDEGMASLFSPFQQTQRMAGGTGLGLFSLSKRVDALGGSYGVRHRQDGLQGSVFWFAIPYRPDAIRVSMDTSGQNPDERRKIEKWMSFPDSSSSAPVRSPSVSLSQLHVSSPLSSSGSSSSSSSILHTATVDLTVSTVLRILIVDDSLAMQKMMAMMLRRQGHAVDTAINGAEAVDILATLPNTYDVVLMDLQMPVMDGLEAMRRIRAAESSVSTAQKEQEGEDTRPPSPMWCVPPLSRQLIVGVSANNDLETINLAVAAGADGFIAKPFTVDGFNTVYRHLLLQRELEGETTQ